MTIIDWSALIQEGIPLPTAMTIGVFDGVHTGHRELMDRILKKAPELIPTVVTFSSNPKTRVRDSASYEGDILSLDQKMDVLDGLGIGFVVLIDFSKEFSKMAGKDFVCVLRERGNMRYLAVGSDFRCGYRLDTDAPQLERMNRDAGVATEVVPPKLKGALPVSSSRIRAAIAAGDLVEASALLGRNVEIDLEGVPTTPGAGTVGFCVSASHRITPPDGWYDAVLKKRYSAALWNGTVSVSSGVVSVPTEFACSGTSDALRIELLA